MPSERKQLNIRLSEEGHERLARLLERMRARSGPDVTQAQVVESALIELEEYLVWLEQAKKGRKRRVDRARDS